MQLTVSKRDVSRLLCQPVSRCLASICGTRSGTVASVGLVMQLLAREPL
jgi:hypothetical protein